LKDHIRDYATAAFRFYARWQGKDNYIRCLVDDLQRQKGSGLISPTEAAVIHKEQVIETYKAEIADLEAVEGVIKICERHYTDVLRTVKMIYFVAPDKTLKWGDIVNRVHDAELTIPASDRQIYRWLKQARTLFAEERGLRL